MKSCHYFFLNIFLLFIDKNVCTFFFFNQNGNIELTVLNLGIRYKHSNKFPI